MSERILSALSNASTMCLHVGTLFQLPKFTREVYDKIVFYCHRDVAVLTVVPVVVAKYVAACCGIQNTGRFPNNVGK